MDDAIYEVIDDVLFPWEIDAVLDKAILLCPAMKRENAKLYPQNAKRAVPSVCIDETHAYLVAELLNALAKWI